MYIVIERFADMQNNNKIYEVGDEYKGSKERLAELSGKDNRIGRPLIEKVVARRGKRRNAN